MTFLTPPPTSISFRYFFTFDCIGLLDYAI
jgi:hypothetical protein